MKFSPKNHRLEPVNDPPGLDLSGIGYMPNPDDSIQRQLEKAVLGAILLDPLGLSSAARYLTPAYFEDPNHKHVFEAMLSLWNKDTQIDDITVCYELIAMGHGKNFGDVRWVAFLSQRLTGALHIEDHCLMLAEAYRRKIMQDAAPVLLNAGDPTQESAAVLARVHDMLNTATETRKGEEVTIGEHWMDMQNRPPDPAPMPMGMGELDNLVGLAEGSFNIIGAFPGGGKTAFALNVALHFAEQKHKVWMVSVEMDASSLVRRAQSIYTGIDGTRIFMDDLTDEERNRITVMGPQLYEVTARISVDNVGEMDLQRFAAIADRKVRNEGVKLIIVDYLQIITPDPKAKGDYEQNTSVSKVMRRTARILKTRILALSQLTEKAGRTSAPTQHDLRSSKQYTMDAWTICLLGDDGEVNIVKNRNGKKIKTNIDVDLSRFRMGPRALQPVVAPF